jgi:hypothetical protein
MMALNMPMQPSSKTPMMAFLRRKIAGGKFLAEFAFRRLQEF